MIVSLFLITKTLYFLLILKNHIFYILKVKKTRNKWDTMTKKNIFIDEYPLHFNYINNKPYETNDTERNESKNVI